MSDLTLAATGIQPYDPTSALAKLATIGQANVQTQGFQLANQGTALGLQLQQARLAPFLGQMANAGGQTGGGGVLGGLAAPSGGGSSGSNGTGSPPAGQPQQQTAPGDVAEQIYGVAMPTMQALSLAGEKDPATALKGIADMRRQLLFSAASNASDPQTWNSGIASLMQQGWLSSKSAAGLMGRFDLQPRVLQSLASPDASLKYTGELFGQGAQVGSDGMPVVSPVAGAAAGAKAQATAGGTELGQLPYVGARAQATAAGTDAGHLPAGPALAGATAGAEAAGKAPYENPVETKVTNPDGSVTTTYTPRAGYGAAQGGAGQLASPGRAADILDPNAAMSGSTYASRVTGVENRTGNSGARNPGSTATGDGQFIDGTWQSLMQSARPDLTAGKTPEQILAMRSNPGLSAQMIVAYAQQNAPILQRAGFPVNSATLGLAHRLGPDGAIQVLSAPPNTPLSTILGPSVLAVNPDLVNQTAGSFVHGAIGRYGNAPVQFGQGGPPPSATAAAQAPPAAQATAAPPAGAPAGSRPIAIGDSIAQGAANVNGYENAGVKGIGPAAILANINRMPDGALQGRSVVLSPGMSNVAPNQVQAGLATVQQQIDAARAKGATDIQIAGVSEGRFPGVNDKLALIAQQNGLPFSGPLQVAQPTDVHPGKAGYQALALRPATPPPPGSMPTAATMADAQRPITPAPPAGQPGAFGGGYAPAMPVAAPAASPAAVPTSVPAPVGAPLPRPPMIHADEQFPPDAARPVAAPLPAAASAATPSGPATIPGTVTGTSMSEQAKAGIEITKNQITSDHTTVAASLSAAQAAQAQQQNLMEMRTLGSSGQINTGSFGEARQAVQNYLATFAPEAAQKFVTALTAGQIDPSKAGATQEFVKVALQAASSAEKANNPAGGLGITQVYQSAFPNLETQPSAIRDMSNLFLISQQRTVDHAQGQQAFLNGQQTGFMAPGGKYQSVQNFDSQFMRTNPPQVYVGAAAALNDIPYARWSKGLTSQQQQEALSILWRADPTAQPLGVDGKTRFHNPALSASQ